MEIKITVLIIVCLALGFIVGFAMGVQSCIQVVTEVAKNFVEIDYDAVNSALYQYRNHINLMN